jgi:8-oxo-dGTP diphosphatase
MPSTEPDATPVAVGIIQNAQHRILVAQRPDHKHQGGKWEFPGGKIHVGETVRTALARELHEELGITLRDACPMQRVRHVYADRRVLLDVWRVTDYTGELHGREGQPLRWVTPQDLDSLDVH